jgi:tRNA U54 and U55 pseudouridine synthase Pus10
MSKDKIRKLEYDIKMNKKIMTKLESKVKSLEFTNQQKKQELQHLQKKHRKSVL